MRSYPDLLRRCIFNIHTVASLRGAKGHAYSERSILGTPESPAGVKSKK